jgi:hypothetical protein
MGELKTSFRSSVREAASFPEIKSPANLPAPVTDLHLADRTKALAELTSGSLDRQLAAVRTLTQPEVANKQSIAALVKTMASDNYDLRTAAQEGLSRLAISAAKSPETSALSAEVLNQLIDSFGKDRSLEEIRIRLSARVAVQDAVYGLGLDPANRDVLAPITKRLTDHIINGPERYQSLSTAAVEMAVFNQTFDDHRSRVFNSGPGFETRRTLPMLLTEGFAQAAMASRKDKAFISASQCIANLVTNLPDHKNVIEVEAQSNMAAAEISQNKAIKKAAPRLIAAMEKIGIKHDSQQTAENQPAATATFAANRGTLEQAIIPVREHTPE